VISRRFVRFSVVGILGFLVDSASTMFLIALGLSPLIARVPAIAMAMIVTWLANRTFTFSVTQKATAHEAGKYLFIAASAAALNYVIYSLLVLVQIPVIPSIVIATCIVATLSYFSYKKFAFSAS
jgi:putative flippase GtrA